MARRSSSTLLRAAAFAALGDPTRLAIADRLAASDLTPSEIVDFTGCSSPLVAHHLDVLEAAGIVRRAPSEADGRKRFVILATQWRGVLAPAIVPDNVLFVCTRNSARSQMAAAIWRGRIGQRASSAGTHPAERVHPSAVRIARRHGFDLSSAEPTRFDPARTGRATVITVCDRAHDDLGVGGSARLHWSVPDPAASGDSRDFESAFRQLVERIGAIAPSTADDARRQAMFASHHDGRTPT